MDDHSSYREAAIWERTWGRQPHLDGSIGKVDVASYDMGRSFGVVDTGPGSSAGQCCFRQA